MGPGERGGAQLSAGMASPGRVVQKGGKTMYEPLAGSDDGGISDPSRSCSQPCRQSAALLLHLSCACTASPLERRLRDSSIPTAEHPLNLSRPPAMCDRGTI